MPTENDFRKMLNKMYDYKKKYGSSYIDIDSCYDDVKLYETLKDIYLNNGDAKMCFIDTCCICNNEIKEKDNQITFNDKDYCKECFDKQKFCCVICENKFFAKDITINKITKCFICHNCKDKYSNCNDCGQLYLTSEESVKGVCKKCFKKNYTKCNLCNSYHKHSDLIHCFDKNENELFVCPDCEVKINISKCSCCSKRYINNIKTYNFSDGSFRDNRKLCNKCFNENYFICEDCEITYSKDCCCRDISGNHCKKCNPDPIVLNYSYKPFRFKFASQDGEENPVFLGIEFEIGGCSSASNVEKLVQRFTNRNFLYFKKDSSIPRNGVEIVSHPATFEAHKNKLPWKSVFQSIHELGITDTSNCGIHCHIGKDKLNTDEISFLDCFINMNFEVFEELCGRKFNDYCKHVYKRRSEWGVVNYDRHSAVNIGNSNTVELRFCASTNNYDTFMERLEFINSIIQFTKKEQHKANDIFVANDMILKSYLDFCKNNFSFIRKHIVNILAMDMHLF